MESVMVIFGKYKICWREKYEQSAEVDFMYRLGEVDVDEGGVTFRVNDWDRETDTLVYTDLWARG